MDKQEAKAQRRVGSDHAVLVATLYFELRNQQISKMQGSGQGAAYQARFSALNETHVSAQGYFLSMEPVGARCLVKKQRAALGYKFQIRARCMTQLSTRQTALALLSKLEKNSISKCSI